MLEQLTKREVPDVLTALDGTKITTVDQWNMRRQQIATVLCQQQFGFLPPPPTSLTFKVLSVDERFCAGKAPLTKVMLCCTLEDGAFSFPISCVIPKGMNNCPAFLHINFRDDVPDKYMPTEEICDNGFAVFSFCYQDISADADDGFAGGLAGHIVGTKDRTPTQCGKIALWAWAASRVMDYIQTLPQIDHNNVAIIGHSRLGKTALLVGGLDQRFAHVISNDSGCGGAAITRDKTGEHLDHLCNAYFYWFCENYKQYINNEHSLPFDAHFLLALVAPRNLCVGSAALDEWADPDSEYLSCIAAQPVWHLLGANTTPLPDRPPQTGDVLHHGAIGYHKRAGAHYLSRQDWLYYMEFIKKTISAQTGGMSPLAE